MTHNEEGTQGECGPCVNAGEHLRAQRHTRSECPADKGAHTPECVAHAVKCAMENGAGSIAEAATWAHGYLYEHTADGPDGVGICKCPTPEPCNCEHARHFPKDDGDLWPEVPNDGHAYLGVPAGERTRAYLGAVCDACADICLPRAEYAIRITWNAYPDEPASFISAGDSYPPPVARYTLTEARDMAACMAGRFDNAHLSFAVVAHPEAFPA